MNIEDTITVDIEEGKTANEGDYVQILSSSSDYNYIGILGAGYDVYECLAKVISIDLEANTADVQILAKTARQATNLGGGGEYYSSVSSYENYLFVDGVLANWWNKDTIIPANYDMIDLYIKQQDIVDAIGLTADKIKAGETVLGITGTYTGETAE